MILCVMGSRKHKGGTIVCSAKSSNLTCFEKAVLFRLSQCNVNKLKVVSMFR